MFDGFTLEYVDVEEVTLRVRHGGSGPAVLLLQGHPRTHTTWHDWFFLGQTTTPAEQFIDPDPEAWYEAWTTNAPERLGAGNHAAFLEAIHNPDTVHAMCEDYRAGLGIDRSADETDRAAGRLIQCPTLFIWAERDDMEAPYGDPVEVWRPWAPLVAGQSIDCGHHIAEEAPERLATLLADFLRPQPDG